MAFGVKIATYSSSDASKNAQDGGPCALDQLGAHRRRRVDRVRVAEHGALEQLDVLAQLRGGEQAAAGVVQVGVAAVVQACEVRATQLVERGRLGVSGVGAQERSLRGFDALGFSIRGAHPTHRTTYDYPAPACRRISMVVCTGRASETATRQVSSAFAMTAPHGVLVLVVGGDPDRLLDAHEPEATVGTAAGDALGPDGELLQRKLLALGEGGDRHRQAGAGGGDERVLRAPEVGVGALELGRGGDRQRLLALDAGGRPPRPVPGDCDGEAELPVADVRAHDRSPSPGSASASTCSSKKRPIDAGRLSADEAGDADAPSRKTATVGMLWIP